MTPNLLEEIVLVNGFVEIEDIMGKLVRNGPTLAARRINSEGKI
jgi:hypothetical protein